MKTTTRFQTLLRGGLGALLGGLLAAPTAQAQTVPAGEGLVADTTEMRVLREFYAATGGDRWTTRTHWLQGTTLAEAATWHGVTVSGGDVTRLVSAVNNLQGTLPASLGLLAGLTHLQLSDSYGLTGPLPRGLGELRRLESLIVVSTEVTGPIPREIGQLTALTYLSFFNNSLSGPIPPELGNLAQLQVLYLGNYYRRPTGTGNQYQGGLPATLGRLTALTLLHVSRSAIGGPIPPELGNLTNLATLVLAGTGLTGPVPPALATLPRLATLNLSGNQLTQLPSWPAGATRGGLQLSVQDNWLGFGSLERNFVEAQRHPFAGFTYAPQAMPPGADTVRYVFGDTLRLRRSLGGQYTHYRWQRQADNAWVDVADATDTLLVVPAADVSAEGLYRVAATNDWVTDLTLYSKAVYARGREGCPALMLNVSPAVSLPAGDAATLRAYPSLAGAAVQWSPAVGLSATTGLSVTAFPTVTTTYTATATSAAPCTATVTATVTVTVTPALALANPPVDGCTPALVDAAPAERPGPDPVNFVRTFVPRVALTDTTAVRLGAKEQVQVKTEYLDGLGRPVQTVLRQEAPLGNDVVQPVAYDALGRQAREYLPYVADNPSGNAGAYRPNAVREQYDFYRATPTGPGFATDHIARTGVAYGEKQFEASPLNRVLAQGAPGEAWQLTLTGGHATRREERPNTADDAIPRWVPGYGTAPADYNALAPAGDYAAGELWAVESSDEQGQRSQAFTDRQGQVVAKRTKVTAGTWLSTYYVYDDFPRLRAVVPPKAAVLLRASSGQVTPAVDSLLFRYRYDARGRVLGKQVPGTAGETQLVYDQLDRLVLSQDAQQRARAEWAFTKYDALGRAVLTGLVTREATAAALQAEAEATENQYEVRTAGAAPNYSTDRAYPRLGQQGFAAGQVLTANYYDDYNFDNDAAGTPDAAYDPQYNARLAVAPQPDARVTGLPTRTRVRVLGVPDTDPGAWLTTTTFYDERARPVQVQATNARGGQDMVTTQLDFQGKVEKSYAVHTVPDHPTLAVAETMRYDHAGRLLDTRQQVDNEPAPVTVASHRYNEVGQLVQKTLAPGGGALQQAVDYRYNVRGWLTHLNDADNPLAEDLFNLTLNYNCGFDVPQFNGNIAGQKWRGRDGIERAYGYLYDGANRLLQGDFVARNAGTQAWTAERQRYGLAGVRYDENGNILALQRRGLLAAGTRRAPARYGATDALSYAYAGNRLLAVNDAVSTNQLPRPAGYQGAPASLAGDFQEQGVRQAQEYAYDANGSLTQDRNKGVTDIRYNHLSLPERISFSPTDYLEFHYTATGQKVAKLVYQTGKPVQRTDYLGPYQYEQDSLRFFPHAEGRVLRTVNATSGQVTYQREYTMKDHLGNLRLAYRAPGRPVTYTATLEQDAPTHTREAQQFDSLSVSPPVAQPAGTRARSGTYAAKLNAGGAAPQPLGPLKQLAVQKGDTVTITAPGLYPQKVQRSFWFSLASFLTGLLQPAPNLPAPPDGVRRGGLPLLQVGVAAGLTSLPQLSGGVPKGYVRLLVFDADSTLVSQQTQQLSSAALNNYESLRLRVVVPQDGYVTAYVGNESSVDVVFDDVTFEHRPGLQVQETQYDPWGLSLTGVDYSSSGMRRLNQYQFNGKERQNDLGLGWSDYGARFYDNQAPHWTSVDPLAEKMRRWSPYAFSFDNPLRFLDADGMAPNDTFDRQGKPVKSTPKGDEVLVQNSNGSTQPLSKAFKGGANDVRMLRNITMHYANQVGVKNGTRVGVGQSTTKGVVAFFNGSDNSIKVNASGNKINSALDNANSFRSVLEHEKIHQDNFEEGIEDDKGTAHADVYIKQMKSQNFRSSPKPFREGTVGGMIKEIFRDTNNFAEEARNYISNNNKVLTSAGLNVQVIQTGPCQTCAEYKVNNHPASVVPSDQ